jgi:hypothetical protein
MDALEADVRLMRGQMDHLVALCVAAKAESAAGGVPQSLVAAAHAPRPDGETVRLRTAAGGDVIAIVDGRGDPAEWWCAIQKIAAQ